MSCNHCLLFVAGLLASFAYDDLSNNKIATQSYTYNNFEASRAVDGNIATCMQTNAIGTAATFNNKTVWWKVDLGAVYSIYSINILFRNYDGYVERQRGRFAGFSLHVSSSDVSTTTYTENSSTLCYKDGPQLPPLNFTAVCLKQGRYVIYYNERLPGTTYPKEYEHDNVYTELCEVKVQGCHNISFYGSNCNKPCPINCKENMCHIQNGACFVCKVGWIGINCDSKCIEGWYSVNCSHKCSGHCKDATPCNHVTGRCDAGCDAGWTGLQCNKECKDGTYGFNCMNNCSGHCLNDSPCNKQTGHCDRGCNPGYTNNDCSTVCYSGYFGMDCREKCSGRCTKNEPCDHVSGRCPNGCQDGFVGTLCDKSCNKGYFGRNCSSICSPNCKSDICRYTDGSCISCAVGWTGENCSEECFQSYGEKCLNSCSPHCYNRTCDRFNGQCLVGCEDGFYGEMCERGRTETLLMKKDMYCCIFLAVGLSISLLINLILIGCGILLCRKINSKGTAVSYSLLSCWKKSDYQETFVKKEEASAYQELDLTDRVYQNTAIR